MAGEHAGKDPPNFHVDGPNPVPKQADQWVVLYSIRRGDNLPLPCACGFSSTHAILAVHFGEC